jgi:uncharacterized membrane protein
MDQGQLWFLVIHVTAAGLALGGMAFFGGIYIPRLRRSAGTKPGEAARLVVAGMRAFHPFYLACLGVLIVSGGLYLTRLKIGLGAEYFPRLVKLLGTKLLLVFVVAMLSSYQCFAVGVPLERSLPADGEGNGSPAAAKPDVLQRQASMLGRLQWCALANTVLLIAIIALGLAMGRF